MTLYEHKHRAAAEHDTAAVAKHECGPRPRPRIVSALCYTPYNCTTPHAYAAVEEDVDTLQTKIPIATVHTYQSRPNGSIPRTYSFAELITSCAGVVFTDIVYCNINFTNRLIKCHYTVYTL